MSTTPADLARLPRKGRLALGSDADMAILGAEDTFVVDARALQHKNPITPYDGRALAGVVRKTFLRGQEVDRRTPTGRLLRRGA